MTDQQRLTDRKKPLLRRLVQIGLVVRNVDTTATRYWDEFGVGPWTFHTYDPSCVSDMKIHGRREDYAMRLAFAKIGEIGWELIQPLDSRSIYSDHLHKHGESIHHLQFAIDDYSSTKSFLKSKAYDDIQSGSLNGLVTYHYYDTQAPLGLILEITSPIPDEYVFPPPEKEYPSVDG